MALDRVPGDAQLHIGGLFTLKRKEALKEANITHVLSVLTLPLDEALFEGYSRLVIDVDDDEGADIIQHFPASNAFIQEGLDGGGGVLVHCAMGKSRSATLILAYLLSTSQLLTPISALMHLRLARPIAEPNPGFMDQLHLYHRMHCPREIDSQPLYQRWCYEREKERRRKTAQAPGSEFIVFEDEVAAPSLDVQEKVEEEGKEGDGNDDYGKPRWDIRDGEGGKTVTSTEQDEIPASGEEQEQEEYRCRRCRTQLGNSIYKISHTPPRTGTSKQSPPPPQQCSHLFLHPLSWMRPTLAQGNLEGRLECPNAKCKQNVGKYAWQGMKCSCGEWVVPGISVGRGKVDVIAVRRTAEGRVGR
ncbi:MAG: hypothetical protein Q9216_005461 [Gyalolechia sp. 2 TL-2023]